ncbi:uncharacterized protein si:dkeyp-97a10.3 isoform X2 [Entelurus aequoreus]|uniref:uncharacterized protein si:dkeyp-97a10.3 isoform X2 n=1 Tax=Entelurus aequoreus TaxID=161455 RepID=UPI002B1CF88A|nr:uncharacterized protein si:dkeyp-97a10.3 isoform X2 [Entelurus aequoreus]
MKQKWSCLATIPSNMFGGEKEVLSGDMRQLVSFFFIGLSAALVQAQDQVQIQFQTDPVLVLTGTEVQFTVLTTPDVLSMTWLYEGDTLGLWVGGGPVINDVPQFRGRVTITATQLRISSTRLEDAGAYTVEVEPLASTGMTGNSRPVQLRVFEAVAGVSLAVPSVAVEGGNITLTCTSGGTEVSFQFGKGGVAVAEDSRITIVDGVLVINPGQRGDAGDYTCTVSNPLSALTASRSLTVFFGPDTPVLTKDAPKDCVGSPDVQVGRTLRLTCMSDSLPPALFTWQRDGEPVASAQPDSGVLSVQTSSTDDGGRFTCAARNAVTGGTSEQATDVSVENTCLDVGEVVGIVIGSLVLLLILVLLLVLLVCLVLRRRARRRRAAEAVVVQKNRTNPRPIPPLVPANGARDLGQGPDPPVFQSSSQARRPRLQASQPGDGRWPNGTTRNGVDNPAFTRDDPRPTNPNILIQTGGAGSVGQPGTVQLSLNALPQGGQQKNTPMPTIHVNLNSFPASGPQEVTRINNNNNNDPYPGWQNSNGATSQQPVLVPPSSHTAQRNANTQTYQQEAELHNSSAHRQMPWDRLRGTPAYPGAQSSDDYTSHAPLQHTRGRDPFTRPSRTRSHSADVWETRTLRVPKLEPAKPSHKSPLSQRERSQEDLRARGQSTNPFVRQAAGDPLGVDTRAMADPNHLHLVQTPLGLADPNHLHLVQTPQGLADPNHLHLVQTPQGLADPNHLHLVQTPQGLADPNHLHLVQTPQGLADPNHLLLVQTPQGLADPNHLLLVQTPQGASAPTHGAGPPRQSATAVVPKQPQSSALTQAVLKAHTNRAQTFQNRKQQTLAALRHPGTQTQAPATAADGTPRPPTPPTVIPLTRFQSLPRTRHKSSPTRGPHQQPQRRPHHRPGHHHHHHPANVETQGHAHTRQAQRGAPRW